MQAFLIGLKNRKISSQRSASGQMTHLLEEDHVEEIPQQKLVELRIKALSQKNFAVLCMREIFTEEERANSNFSGNRGRKKLDPSGKRLRLIFKYIMDTYHVAEVDQANVWRDCQQAMNDANVYLRRVFTQNNS